MKSIWTESRLRGRGRAVFLGLLLVGLASPPGRRRSAEGALTPEQVARLQTVSSAVISPDGASVAYTLAVPRRPFVEEDGPAWQELHVASADGRTRPFVVGKVNVSQVAWQPDGRGISFLAKRGDDKETALYVIPIDGGEGRRALSHPTGIRRYSWSPDGSRLAFLATEPESEQLRTRKEKGFAAIVHEEDWRAVRVWVGKAAPAGDAWVETAKTDEPRALELEGSAFEVEWDPTGTRLAVAMAPTPLVDDELMSQRVVFVDVETSAMVGSAETSGKIGQFSWSPDGEQLALVAAEDEHDPREGRLVVVGREGGAVRELVPDFAGHIWSFAWLDASSLVYVGEEGVWNTLGTVSADGSSRRTLIPPGRGVFGSLSLSRDGRRGAVVGQSAAHPEEVYMLELPRADLRRLTQHNGWLAEMSAGRTGTGPVCRTGWPRAGRRPDPAAGRGWRHQASADPLRSWRSGGS